MNHKAVLFEKTNEILKNLPEVILPGVTLISGVYEMGMHDLGVAIGKKFTENTAKKFIVFIIDTVAEDSPDRFDGDEYIKLTKENFIIHNNASTFCEIIDVLNKVDNLGMIILTNPEYIQADNSLETTLYIEECYEKIREISNKYSVPVLVSSSLSSRSVNSRINHLLVKYDILNWHLIEKFVDNILLVHRDGYFDGRIKNNTTTLIIEQTKSRRMFEIKY